MRTFFCASILFISLVCRGQDFLEWSEGIQLNLHDFKGENPQLPGLETVYAAFWIDLKLDSGAVVELTHFNACISNYISREYSWIDKLDLSRLRYANTLFYIKEWETREIWKNFYERKDNLSKANQQQILEDIRMRFEQIQVEYADASQQGDDLAIQVEWEDRIINELSLLSEFCKNCNPTN